MQYGFADVLEDDGRPLSNDRGVPLDRRHMRLDPAKIVEAKSA